MRQLLVHLVILTVVAPAGAATWTVDDDGVDFPGADFTDIQSAIDAASNGDEVLVYPGSYTNTGDWVINPSGKAITIHSIGGPALTTLDGEGLRGVVYCNAAETAQTIIEGFTVTGGVRDNGGGVYCRASSPTFSDCVIHGNTGVSIGGGVCCYYLASPTFNDCIIRNNTTWNGGGGVYCFLNSNASLSNCLIEDNTVSYNLGGGGGIYCYNSNLTLTACTVSGNIVKSAFYDSAGGGMYCQNSSPVLVDTTVCGNLPAAFQIWGAEDWVDGGGNCVISSCEDADGNGIPDACENTDGILEVPSDFPTVQAAIDAAVDGNTVLVSPGTYTSTQKRVIDFVGKAITLRSTEGPEVTTLDGEGVRGVVMFDSNETAESIIDGFTITGGTTGGTYGAGVYCYDSSPTIKDCIIDGNTTSVYGGGVYCGGMYCSPSFDGCTIRNNTAGSGGGIQFFGVASPSLNNCSIENNTANGGTGGGMSCYLSTATLTACTVTGNTADAASTLVGVGIDCYLSDLTLIGCTISGNNSPTGEGLVARNNSSISLEGDNASDTLWCEGAGTAVSFDTDSTLNITGDCTPSAQGAVFLDVDDINAAATLQLSGTLTGQGSLTISNDSGSLVQTQTGDVIAVAQAGNFKGGFYSIVLPVMPEGLGLQLVAQVAIVGGISLVLEVIDVDGADFTSPFTEGLDSDPVDIVSFDVDGDGADEIAVLFGGSPGGVAVYTVTEGAAPVLIAGLVELVGNDPVDLDTGDLNSDGLADLLVANAADSTLSVLLAQEDVIDGSPYFDVATVSIPGSGQTLTCASIIDWDGDTMLDAVAGVDRVNPAWQVMLDVAGTSAAGSAFTVANTPAAVHGGDAVASWGFAGGTQSGLIQHADASTGVLSTLADLNGNQVVTIEALDMDGDGQLDIMAVSDEAESIYLLPGVASEADGFGGLIPIAVGEPVEDVVALDVDADGDMDMIMASPTSANYPLLLLRNDGVSGGALVQPLGGITWSMQAMATGGSPHRLAGGMLNNKDDDDDWVIGGGGGLGFAGDVGVLEQTNLLDNSGGCPEDIDGNGTVNIDDLLLVLGNYNGTGEGDVDGNGVVNIDDMLLVIGAWNTAC